MRLILQLCVMVLMLFGVGNRVWGKVAVGQNIAVRGFEVGEVFCAGADEPPALVSSGEAAAWGYDVASDVRDGPNVYAYVKQNPWTGFDPEGLWVEDLAIGVPSIGVGAASLWSNVKKGNVGSAIWDGVGIVADAAAVAIPGVPGGVGLATKAARAGAKVVAKVEKVVEKVEKVQEAVEVVTAVASGDPTVIVEKLVDKAVDKAMGGKKGKGGDAPGPKGQKQVQAETKTKVDADVPQGGTYKLKDPDTGQVRRTGKTNDLERRKGEHARGDETKDLDFEVDRRSDNEAARRGREQIIHDQHPEADLNKKNPISPSNPKRDGYMEEGKKL